MTSKSIQSNSKNALSLSIDLRQQLKQWMQNCRASTLALFEEIDGETFCRHVHPDFSPVGWHLGHIAYTEALWLLERSAGLEPLFPEYRRLFAADGLPKTERVKLPTLEAIRDYLDIVRNQVLSHLETAHLEEQERLWRWLIQHESQHSETITFVLQLQRLQDWQFGRLEATLGQGLQAKKLDRFDMVEIPAGEFKQGNNDIDALDNEQPIHRLYLDTYWIDRYPVTCRQYQAFIEAGGYQNSEWWSNSGWKWLQDHPVHRPLYWVDAPEWENHPVCGVSWYEAEAYARFVGKRLPTEAEWEKAASWDLVAGRRRTYPWGETTPDAHYCNHDNQVGHTTPVNGYPTGQSAYGLYDVLGNVWEWTDSWFDGYEGFVNYPYAGYSKVYFDKQHRVLRGGSWATRPWVLRCSFRNWYHPGVRQILAGFRCARSGSQ